MLVRGRLAASFLAVAAVIVAALLLALYGRQPAAEANPPGISFSVDAVPGGAVDATRAMPVGVPFSVDVVLDSFEGFPWQSYQVTVDYDDVLLDATGIPQNWANPPVLDTTGGNLADIGGAVLCDPSPTGYSVISENDAGTGSIAMTCAPAAVGQTTTATGPLVEFVFVCEVAGTAAISVRDVNDTFVLDSSFNPGNDHQHNVSIGCGQAAGTATPTPSAPTATATATLTATATPTIGPPQNDDFELARVVTTAPLFDVVDMRYATLQPAEPRTCFYASRTVWYAYTAPRDVVVRATVANSSSGVAAYSGGSLGSLSLLSCGVSYYFYQPPTAEVQLAAGQTVYFQALLSDFYVGALQFSLQSYDPPPNDAFANASVLGAVPATDAVSFLGAGVQPDEPLACQVRPTSSVWYAFTAPRQMVLRADTSGSDFSVSLDMFAGPSISQLTRIGGCGSPLQTEVAAGQTIYIRAWSNYLRGNLKIAFQEVVPPPNDNLVNAKPITTLPFSEIVDLRSASREASELLCYGSDQNTVWYSFVAPSNTVLQVQAQSNLSTNISVFDGTSFADFTRRDCAGGQMRVGVRTGEAVYIQLATDRSSNPVTITVTALPAPANDFFDSATPMTAFPFTASANVSNASTELGEPGDCNSQSTLRRTVWYRYAPVDETTIVASLRYSGYPIGTLALYSGPSLGQLTRLACGSGDLRVRVHAGDQIWLLVSQAYYDTLNLQVQAFAVPLNDDFSQSLPITSLPYSHTENIDGATLQPNEPTACGYLTGSVWFTFTAIEDTNLSLDPANGFVAAYRGTFPGLTQLTCGYGPTKLLVTAGSTIFIQGAGSGAYTLNAKALIPPPNDSFSGAQSITTPFSAQVILDSATAEATEPQSCGYGPSVWYRYTATADVMLIAQPQGGTVALFRGDQLNALTLLACSDYGTAARRLATGDTVYLRYTGRNGTIRVDAFARPANDDFANAEDITSLPFQAVVDLNGASYEGDELSQCGRYGVWYRFTAQTHVVIDAQNGRGVGGGYYYNTSIGAFTGNSINTLTTIACNSSSAVRVDVQAGQTIYLRVAASQVPGPTRVSVNVVGFTPPPNDDRLNAKSLSSLPFAEVVDTRGATNEQNEPGACRSIGTVWYQYTAPADEYIDVDMSGSIFNGNYYSQTKWTMYDDALVPIASSCDQWPFYTAVAHLRAEQHVFIQIGVQPQTLVLHLDPVPRPSNDNFADASVVTTLPYTQDLDFAAAELESSEPASCGPVAATLWSQFTAPRDMSISIGLSGYPDDNFVAAAYTGDSLATAAVLGCGDYSHQSGVRLQIGLTAGQTIHIQAGVKRRPLPTYDATLSIVEATVPPNDNFLSARPIGSLPFSESASTTFATLEPGEPQDCVQFGSIWYSYTAPAPTKLDIDTSSSDFASRYVGVFAGASVNGLTRLACGQGHTTVSLNAGATVFIQIGGYYSYYGENGGTSRLRVGEAVRPANDDRANATEITSTPFTDHVNTLGATDEPGEQSCGGTPAVWYRYVATSDTVLVVGNTPGSPSEYSRVDVVSNAGTSSTDCSSSIVVRVKAGETAYIRASAGYNYYDLGISVVLRTPLPNDDFSTATQISSLPFADDVDLTYATLEYGEPTSCGYGDGTVWYRYTAPADGLMSLDVGTDDFGSPTIGAYSGETLGSLTRIACSGDRDVRDHLQIRVSAGQTYYFRVLANYGRVTFSAAAAVSPPNDNFVDAEDVTSLPFAASVSRSGSTLEPGELSYCHTYISGSRWYTFTPDHDMKLLVRAAPSSEDSTLAVFRGTSLSALTVIDCSTDHYRTELLIDAKADVPLFFQLGGTLGDVTFEIIPVEAPDNDAMATPRIITSIPYDDTVNLVGATEENDEPYFCNSYRTAWYSYTADTPVDLRVETYNAGVASFVSSGGPPGVDNAVECGRQQLHLDAGQTLYLRLSPGGSGWMANLTISAVHPPPNDRIDNATEIPSLPFSAQADTSEAWRDSSEPECHSIDKTVWYRYAATTDGTLIVDADGSDFDTVLAAYVAINYPLRDLYPVACDDEFLPTDHEVLNVPVRAGDVIYIQAGGYIDFTGHLALNVKLAPTVPNDAFHSSEAIADLPFTADVDISGATAEIGESSDCWNPSQHTVWYRYTASSDVTLSVDVHGTGFPVAMAAYVFTYTALPPRPRDAVACDAPGYLPYPPPVEVPAAGIMQFTLRAGQTAYIQVGTGHREAGTLHLHVLSPTAPANDNFENATNFATLPFSDEVPTHGATRQEFENSLFCGGPRTVWYSFTAPRDLVLDVDTAGSDYDTTLAAYADSAGAEPTYDGRLSCDTIGTLSHLRLPLHAGDRIFIQASGPGGQLKLNASVGQEGLPPDLELLVLSPIALERELITLRDALHDNIEPSVFDDDGLSFFELCTIVHKLRVTAGQFDRANRLNSNGDFLPCGESDYIPPGEITPGDFATINLDADQLSQNAASYTDGVIVVAFVNGLRPLEFSSPDGSWRRRPGDVAGVRRLCAIEFLETCAAGDGYYEGRGGLLIASLSGPISARGTLEVSAELQGPSPFLATAGLHVVGDPTRLTLRSTKARVETGDGASCNLPVYAERSGSVPEELLARSAAFDAALLVANVTDSDGTPLSNIPVDWSTDAGDARTALAHAFSSEVTTPSGTDVEGANLVCGGLTPNAAGVAAHVTRAANGACTRPAYSGRFGEPQTCYGRTIPELEASVDVAVVGPPAHVTLSFDAEDVICDGAHAVGLQAVVTDSDGRPVVVGHTVAFDGGTDAVEPVSAATDESGFATTSLRPAAGDHLIDVRATTNGIRGEATIPCRQPTATPTFTMTPTYTATNTATATPSPTPSPTAVCDRADVNGDGNTNVRDFLLILHHVVRRRPYDARYDLNADGKVTLADVWLALRCRTH